MRGLRSIIGAVCAMLAAATAAAQGVPTISITTPSGSLPASREVWTEGCRVEIRLPGGKSQPAATASVKSRGHSSFMKEKKPYVIKFAEARAMLGMPKAKRWILLANVMDHSNLRNALAFEISRCTGMAFTPEWRFVRLEINGHPQGLYTLVESVRSNEKRLAGRGGFIAECDAYPDGKNRFSTAIRRMPVNVKRPHHPTSQEMSNIENFFNNMERELYPANPDYGRIFSTYIDASSFADWWLVHELAQNAEPNGPRSCYFHRKGRGRLAAGPVWDFDLAFITVGIDSGGDLRPDRFHRSDVRRATGDSLYNARALWFDALLRSPDFRITLKRRWARLRPKAEKLTGKIGKWQAQIAAAAEENERLWPNADPARFDDAGGFRASAERLRQTYEYRIRSLSKLISDL